MKLKIAVADWPTDTRPDVLPLWVCPACGKTNRLRSLVRPRPEGVDDACVCGAVADAKYQTVTVGDEPIEKQEK